MPQNKHKKKAKNKQQTAINKIRKVKQQKRQQQRKKDYQINWQKME